MGHLRLKTAAAFYLLMILGQQVWAADTRSLTVTQNRGMGVNQPNDRTFVTTATTSTGSLISTTGPLGADVPNPSNSFCCFPNTSDPFFQNTSSPRSDGFVDPLLPPSFNTPNTQFGKGVPCGPDDTNGNPSQGIPFPYPCSSDGSLRLLLTNLGVVEGAFKISAPALAPGSPFQTLTSTPLGGGFRQQKIEFGFSQNSAGGSNIDTFYSITTVIGPDGHLVGPANGNFITSTAGVSPLTCDKTFQGSFKSTEQGMDVASCKNNDGTPCQNVQNIPDIFTRSDGNGFCQ